MVPAIESLPVSKQPRLICVGIGTPEKAQEFCKLTSIPKDILYSDADNKVYDALDLLKSNPVSLMTDVRTPLAIASRLKDGKGEYLKEALSNWKPWIPPKLEQGLNQGGAFVFKGDGSLVYGRKDPATGDHIKLDTLLQLIVPASARAS